MPPTHAEREEFLSLVRAARTDTSAWFDTRRANLRRRAALLGAISDPSDPSDTQHTNNMSSTATETLTTLGVEVV